MAPEHQHGKEPAFVTPPHPDAHEPKDTKADLPGASTSGGRGEPPPSPGQQQQPQSPQPQSSPQQQSQQQPQQPHLAVLLDTNATSNATSNATAGNAGAGGAASTTVSASNMTSGQAALDLSAQVAASGHTAAVVVAGGAEGLSATAVPPEVEWDEVLDGTGRPYYFSRKSGKSVWSLPAGTAFRAANRAAGVSHASAVPSPPPSPDAAEATHTVIGGAGRRQLMAVAEAGAPVRRQLQQVQQAVPGAENDAPLTAEADASFEVFQDEGEFWSDEGDAGPAAGNADAAPGAGEGGQSGSGNAGAANEDAPDSAPGGLSMGGDAYEDDAAGPDEWRHVSDYAEWQGDEWDEQPGQSATSEKQVLVDPHLLCSGTVADLDGDGQRQLVLAVSWFYDREQYEAPEKLEALGSGVAIGNYIASGVVVFDLQTQRMRWMVHLDLSTDSTQYRAYAYSTPSVIDLDGDGRLEIVIGTSVGFLYVLSAEGVVREGFPLQMGEIQAQVSVGDVNDDGQPEIVVADTRGNVAVFSGTAKEVWERHLGSLVAQGAVMGDVNGDGRTEVVVATSDGHIYVLNGGTGADVAPFPVRTRGKIMAPVTPFRLRELPWRGLSLVAASFDGFLYVVDGFTGCVTSADIGETAYAAPLVDDLAGTGRSNIVVATMNGNVLCFETVAKHHPLKAWVSQVPAGNGFLQRHDWFGIAATPASRGTADRSGDSFSVEFTIVDRRPAPGPREPGSDASGGRGPYTVTLTLMVPGRPPLRLRSAFATPGIFSMSLPCPKQRGSGMHTFRKWQASLPACMPRR